MAIAFGRTRPTPAARRCLLPGRPLAIVQIIVRADFRRRPDDDCQDKPLSRRPLGSPPRLSRECATRPALRYGDCNRNDRQVTKQPTPTIALPHTRKSAATITPARGHWAECGSAPWVRNRLSNDVVFPDGIPRAAGEASGSRSPPRDRCLPCLRPHRARPRRRRYD